MAKAQGQPAHTAQLFKGAFLSIPSQFQFQAQSHKKPCLLLTAAFHGGQEAVV